MLGRLRMSLDECINAYLSLLDRVFQKKRHRVSAKGVIQGRFDLQELERAVKAVVKGQGLQEDALLKDATNAACKVWVSCITCLSTRRLTMPAVDLSVRRANRLAKQCAS